MSNAEIEARIKRLNDLEEKFAAEAAHMKLVNPWPFLTVLEYLEALREIQAGLHKAAWALREGMKK